MFEANELKRGDSMRALRSRHSIRLKGYDYAQAGAYFVTICTQDRACLFGEIVNDSMRPNDAAKMVQTQWHALPARFPGIELDAFVVMPNHIHGIIVMVGAGLVPGRNVGAGPGILGDHKGHPYRHVPADHDACAAGRVPSDRDGCAHGHVPPRTVGAGLVPARNAGEPGTWFAPTIGDIVGAFKSITTVLYARGTRQSAWRPFRGRVWQRNYYEHVIRDDVSLNRVRQYIVDNPIHWAADRENPAVVTT